MKKQRNTNTGGQFVLSLCFAQLFIHSTTPIKPRQKRAIFKVIIHRTCFTCVTTCLMAYTATIIFFPVSTWRSQRTRCPNKTSNLHPLCFPIHDIPRLDSSTFIFFPLLSHRTAFGPLFRNSFARCVPSIHLCIWLPISMCDAATWSQLLRHFFFVVSCPASASKWSVLRSTEASMPTLRLQMGFM